MIRSSIRKYYTLLCAWSYIKYYQYIVVKLVYVWKFYGIPFFLSQQYEGGTFQLYIKDFLRYSSFGHSWLWSRSCTNLSNMFSIDCLWLTMWTFLQPLDSHSVSNLASWTLVSLSGLSQTPII